MRFRYFFIVQDLQGNAIENASVSVYLAGTTTPATVYLTKDATDGINTAPQLTSGADGKVVFWVDDGDYEHGQLFDIQVEKDTYSFSMVDVQIIPWDVVNAGKLGMHPLSYFVDSFLAGYLLDGYYKEFSYDAEGKVTRIDVYTDDSKSEQIGYIDFSYNANGNVSQMNLVFGDYQYTVDMNYDADGNLISMNSYESGGGA